MLTGEDYSRQIRQIRSNLWKGSEALRAEAKNVRLAFDKPVVDEVTYFWDLSKDNMSRRRVRILTGKRERGKMLNPAEH